MSSAVHLFQTELGHHALIPNGSRIYDIDAELRGEIERTLLGEPDGIRSLLEQAGLGEISRLATPPIADPPIRSLSLAVSQTCNLSCGYCYAQSGTFGKPDSRMSETVAETAVRSLISGTPPGERVGLAFIGGEPLIARPLIRRTTALATELARERQVAVRFAVTTNGTLVTADDADFFEQHGFSVTVSMDGPGTEHDKLRMFQDGRPSYQRVVERIQPLLRKQQRMQVSARVTVTPENLELKRSLDHLLALGFHSVGFAPMLSSPTGALQLSGGHFATMLDQMKSCGDEFMRRTLKGERYAFSNITSALQEIHRGTHRPYPCGAGASYLGVSASGDLSACHRFVEDEAGSMGNLITGVDRERQNDWLARRHVDAQEPCHSCWARYLCGGGCHHEVIHRGRVACDYIRGWLDYCLRAYVTLQSGRPSFFREAN